jgi:flagellar biosynthesis/type III secretory pathway M-ring protein FliF/YscJ
MRKKGLSGDYVVNVILWIVFFVIAGLIVFNLIKELTG